MKGFPRGRSFFVSWAPLAEEAGRRGAGLRLCPRCCVRCRRSRYVGRLEERDLLEEALGPRA